MDTKLFPPNFSILKNFRRPEVFENEKIVLECISGSHAYGLNLPTSDIDVRGVFTSSVNDILTGTFRGGISDPNNDVTYTELFKFIDQISKNAPNALELLFINRPEHLIQRDKRFDLLTPEMVLSKKCYYTYCAYAQSQIKKARSVNKKSLNPYPKERKTLKDFAWVFEDNKSVPYLKWLEDNKIDPRSLSISKMNNAETMYAMYDQPCPAGPVVETNVNLVSIDKKAKFIAYLAVNIDAYQKWIREYNEYWEWVENRNEDRYQLNAEKTGFKTFYDTKNMMHLFRLLYACEGIFKNGFLEVWCADKKDELLRIRMGEYDYEDLLKMSGKLISNLTSLYEKSKLQEKPDLLALKKFCLNFYNL